MDRRKFLKNTGWSFLGLAASGSLLGSCAAGSKEAKKIMPSASNLKIQLSFRCFKSIAHVAVSVCDVTVVV